MNGPTSFTSKPLHHGPCFYDVSPNRQSCMKCALVRDGMSGVDSLTFQETELYYVLLRKRVEEGKDRKAKEDIDELMWKRYGWEKEQEWRMKREQQQKEEREQWTKTHPPHMLPLPANYPSPTATPSYHHTKSSGFKTDIRQQGYQNSNIDIGTAILIQQQKEGREQWKKTHPLHMFPLPANYPSPTANPSYQHRKSSGFKTDIGQQVYQKPNIGRGTAGLPHDIFSPASQAAMPRPPNVSQATTAKTPLMKQPSNRNPRPGRH